MNRYEELIQKYQTLNEFTLSQEDMDLYKQVQSKLSLAIEKGVDLSLYKERFRNINERLSIKPFEDIIVLADTKGHICYGNEEFYIYTGIDKKVIEENLTDYRLSTLRHPDMPKTIFKDLWETIRDGRMWSGIICNRNLRNQDYWQIVNIFPIIENGEITNYIAFNKRAPESIIAEIISFYRKIP